MGKTIYGMFWILSLVMVFLVSNSVLFAQSPVETTTAQSDQGSVDIQQQDIDQQNKTATTSYYYLYLRSLECNYSNYNYAYLKVNGKIVWGPEELSIDTGGIMISIDPIQVNKAKIELYVNSTASSKSAKYVNKIYLTSNDLKNLVDQGEKTYNLTKRYLWSSSEYFDYTLALEVSSTNSSSDSYARKQAASIPQLSWPCSARGINLYFGDDWSSYTSVTSCKNLQWKHAGIDINASAGNDVYAAEAGTVKRTGSGGEWKYYITIEHKDSQGNQYTTVYWHLTNLKVSVGNSVTRGQKIAEVANMGSKTHLHFGIRNASYYYPVSIRGGLPTTRCYALTKYDIWDANFANPRDYLP